jgi:glycerol-3-phosphate O-acyltransferase
MLDAEQITRIVAEVTSRIVARVGEGPALTETLNETLWWEHERLAKLDDGDEQTSLDREFYVDIRRQLPRVSEREQVRLLQQIVHRYAHEIAGDLARGPGAPGLPGLRRAPGFSPTAYKLATRVGPPLLSTLLTGLSPRRLLDREAIPKLDQHLKIAGEVQALARLHERGTLVLAPTHSSNLDSLVLGFAIDKLGLPPLTYGASLSLFSNPLIGRFMFNLGAYTVDRRKHDPLYKQTLKEYATVSLEFGQDNLYFPGGKRSRSGAIERRLKKGLLGCSLAAFRNNLIQKRPQPGVFVVPCTISYPLVLEAATLIDDWLADAGKARYIIVDDEFSRWERWRDYLRGLLSLDLDIHIRFGQPLDSLGNPVDEQGVSHDPRGRAIDPAGYLEIDGKLVDDPIRDAEYTRELERRILAEYRRENVIHSTHVLAFACFELLRRRRPELDLYRLLGSIGADARLDGPSPSLALPEVEDELAELLAELRAWARADRIRLSDTVAEADLGEFVRAALRNFGTYHHRPVLERRGIRLHVGDAKLLFYYRNRLDGYGLRGAPTLVHERGPGGAHA